jgi:hypothetical protein
MWSIVLKGSRHFSVGDGCYTITEAIKELKNYNIITFDDEILSITQQVQGD